MLSLFLLVFLLGVNGVVLPGAGPAGPNVFEDIEMSVFNDGPTASREAGIGAEFETPLFNFQNLSCSLEDTFSAKRKLVKGRAGKNFVLTADTGSTELGKGKLNPEYILDGRNIKVGDGSAAAAGAAMSKDFVSFSLC